VRFHGSYTDNGSGPETTSTDVSEAIRTCSRHVREPQHSAVATLSARMLEGSTKLRCGELHGSADLPPVEKPHEPVVGAGWGAYPVWPLYWTAGLLPFGVVSFEVFTAVTMKNVIFWDIKTQFVPHRRHITSPLQSPPS
jgi:hypothetical protein